MTNWREIVKRREMTGPTIRQVIWEQKGMRDKRKEQRRKKNLGWWFYPIGSSKGTLSTRRITGEKRTA